jgi:hypothetical protein
MFDRFRATASTRSPYESRQPVKSQPLEADATEE